MIFVSCLLMIGFENTVDTKGLEGQEETFSEVVDVVSLYEIGYDGSDIYAIRTLISDPDEYEPVYEYEVRGKNSGFKLASNYTSVHASKERIAPHLEFVRDYKFVNGEKVILSGEGYVDTPEYGVVRCELYLTKGGAGGYELASWY